MKTKVKNKQNNPCFAYRYFKTLTHSDIKKKKFYLFIFFTLIYLSLIFFFKNRWASFQSPQNDLIITAHRAPNEI